MRLLLPVVLLVGIAVAVGAAGPATVVTAKGPVDRISVFRLAWEVSLNVKSGPMLELLSPWRDDFLGAKLPGQPDNTGVNMDFGSQVSFYLEADSGQTPGDPRIDPDGWRLIYYVDYYPDLDGDSPGFIILHNDPRTAGLNNSTIIRETGWYEATATWQAFMASLSSDVVPPRTGDGGLIGRQAKPMAH
jgi:hypothetical protein